MGDSSSSRDTSFRILLLDDDPDDAELVRWLVDWQPNLAPDVTIVPTLGKGLEFIGNHELDVILLDESLEGRSPADLLATIRETEFDLPIIVIGGAPGNAQGGDAQGLEFIQSSAQDYLVRGDLSSDLLARAVRFAVERERIRREQRQDRLHLKILTSQVPAVLWTTDRSLRFTSCVGAALEAANLGEQPPGEPIGDFFTTQPSGAEVIDAHRRALSGESISMETRIAGGHFHLHLEPFRNAQQRITGTIGIALDVTGERRMQRNIESARAIQEALLPKTAPQFEPFEIAGLCRSMDAVGGDFYDFIPLPEGRLAVVQGDVSGHGFGAAILTAATHSYLRALSTTVAEIDEILENANNLLCHDTRPEQFITLLFARLDPRELLLSHTSAGHPAAVVTAADGRIRHSLASTGMPLGVRPNAEFPASDSFRLEPGDVVVIQSDGVLEAMNDDDVLFGSQRVRDVVAARRDDPAAAIAEAVFAAARAHSAHAPQSDDMGVVVVKVH